MQQLMLQTNNICDPWITSLEIINSQNSLQARPFPIITKIAHYPPSVADLSSCVVHYKV